MKKFLISIFTVLFLTLNANADYFDVLHGINNTLNTIDYTESTINRIQNTVPKNDNVRKNNNKNQVQTINTNTPYQSSYPNNNYYNNQNYNQNNSQNYNYQNNTQSPSIRENQQETEIEYKTNDFNQNRTYSGDAKTLKELPAGAIVMDVDSVWNYRIHSNYTGEVEASHPVFWKKLEDNHYENGATLLISVPTVAYYPFCHMNKGLRAWDESDVRRFLRTTFYNHLSQGFKNAIVEVNIPFADMAGNPKTVKDNFFLLSIVEWVLSDRGNNGSAIKYGDLPSMYGALTTISYSDRYKTYLMNSSMSKNWTRTINRPAANDAGYRDDVFVISNAGILETQPSYFDMVVRPAVNLKSSTKVKGPYKFNYNYNENLVYYVLDFSQVYSSSSK